ncbi:hypothetical protein K502DRAFT_368186 [Neoconidiobolus thromboides FSU 785]|nr:hypothetical protein K502DRAFT_368186 [Neoconidiobolus thromboides FSU 785]
MLNYPTQAQLSKLVRPSSGNEKKHVFTHYSAPSSPRPNYYEQFEETSIEDALKANDSVFDEFINQDTSVTLARITYFFDDGHCGGFLSIPHLGRHGSASTAAIARILERWLVEKTSNPADSTTIIPILEEPIDQTTASITERIQAEGADYIGNLAKVAIHVNAGHIFTLQQCCEDDGVLWAAQKFQQEYPLFLDLTIHTVPIGSKPANQPFFDKTKIPISTPSSDSAISYTKVSSDSVSNQTEVLLYFKKVRLTDI